MEAYRKEQIQAELEVMQSICDIQDRSTEFMLQMLIDVVESFKLDYKELANVDSHDFVMEYLYDNRDTTKDT